MKNKKLLSCFIALLVAFGFTANAQSKLISQVPDGIGKQIVSIHSYSYQTKHEEGPANLLFADQSDKEDKWCDNKSEMPWVVFELSDYYDVDKFVIRDVCVREKNNGNIADYQIYVTTKEYDGDKMEFDAPYIKGWENDDWELVVDRTDQGELDVKEDILSTPKKARYIKLVVLDRGYRKDNGNPEDAVRIYGFDIYGSFAEKVERPDNLISVGKSIVDYYKAANKRERPNNLLDGNLDNINSKWCFKPVTFDEPYPYVIFDLEKQYDISEFRVYDCQFLDPEENNFGACDIYVSETAPDLNKVSVVEDENACWKHVVQSEGAEDASELKIKEYLLGAPVKGRFVKLVIPQDRIVAGKASRLYQFEAYGTEAAVDADDATLALLKVSEGLLTPTFDPTETNYTLNVVKEIENITVEASANSSKATTTGIGTHQLNVGANEIKVVVTAENGVAKKEYKITVNRADKSEIATLDTLYIPGAYFATEFISDSLTYVVDVKYGVDNVELLAIPTQEGAKISGLGMRELTNDETELSVIVTAEDGITTKEYKLTVYINPENLISVNFGDPKGKRIVNIEGYSTKENDDEAPSKLLIGRNQNGNGNKRNKWCETSTDVPWVVFSLTDIYEIEKIVVRDGEFANEAHPIAGYEVYFSTTTPDDDGFGYNVAYSDRGGYGGEVTIDELEGELARYIKIIFNKGEDRGVWIYGVDIYGTLAEEVNRGSLVSVGKTIVDYSTYASHRETPHNLIDGNINYVIDDGWGNLDTLICEPWAAHIDKGDAFVIIDLEEEYEDIKEFRLYETKDWIGGYKVSLSTTGNDADWEEVANETFEPEKTEKLDKDGMLVFDEDGEIVMVTVGPELKKITLDEAKRGRYVKLEIPLDMMNENYARIREFEVYTESSTGLKDVSKAEKLTVYPNPVIKGNNFYVNSEGNLKIYTLQGTLVYERIISGANYISTDSFVQGTYLMELTNTQGVQQTKLIVK